MITTTETTETKFLITERDNFLERAEHDVNFLDRRIMEWLLQYLGITGTFITTLDKNEDGIITIRSYYEFKKDDIVIGKIEIDHTSRETEEDNNAH